MPSARLLNQAKTLQDRILDSRLDLPRFFSYKHITSLKNRLLPSPGDSLPSWCRGNFCSHVGFHSLVENISFV